MERVLAGAPGVIQEPEWGRVSSEHGGSLQGAGSGISQEASPGDSWGSRGKTEPRVAEVMGVMLLMLNL